MENTANRITLRGTLCDAPQLSHENHGTRFFRFLLNVPRLSGTADILPVIAQEQLINDLAPQIGGCLTVTGQVRSHNIRADGRRHLLIFVFACQIGREDGPAMNTVQVEGTICRQPTFRLTPLGREICDVMLCVQRSFQRTDYLPCIAWGKVAQAVAGCSVRDTLRIDGRLQSRLYTKLTDTGSEERTAYEISALTAEISKS